MRGGTKSAICWAAFVQFVVLGAHSCLAEVTRYVAPSVLGSGSGTSAANAAGYTSSSFWSGVQSSLAVDAVTVRWLDGQYNSSGLTLSSMGNPDHQLTLVGNTDTGAVLNAPVSAMLRLNGVQNTVIRDLNFTGPIQGYALQITNNGSVVSKKIVMDSLTFTNLPELYYGATGAHHASYDISLRNSTFSAVGSDGHCHMMYNAYDPHHISVYNNTFTNSKGDYVRFRDNSDYGSVIGNTFLSTSSTYNRPMVSMPLFNDVNPGDEYFATNYRFTGNSFTYQSTSGTTYYRDAINFAHYGYEPAGENYLLSTAEGSTLTNGTTAQKKALLDSIGIDGDKVHVYNNSFVNAHWRGQFTSIPQYGAEVGYTGWQGRAEIYNTWNPTAPNLTAGTQRVAWNFDGGDNGGSGWTDHSAAALQAAGWQLSSVDNAKTFVDSDESFAGGSGLLWIRDAQPSAAVTADYQFDYLPQGRMEWRMGLAGAGSSFGLSQGRVNEGGLSPLGIELVDAHTLRILNSPTASQYATFGAVDFGTVLDWQLEWTSDPDGVNGLASLWIRESGGAVHNIYSNRAFDYNIVPDTVWFDTSSNAGASNSIVLDSLAVTVATPTVLPGDFNGDGLVDAADYVVWRRGGAAYTPSDYITWRTHFGQTVFDVATGANLVAATVPEVSSVLLLSVGGLNLLLARRNPRYSWHKR